MIDTVIFDIGNVLTEFRWNLWIRELLGSEEAVRLTEAAMFAESPRIRRGSDADTVDRHESPSEKNTLGQADDEARRISLWDEFDLGEMSDADIIAACIMNDPSAERDIRLVYEFVGNCMYKCEYAIPWIESLKKRGKKVLYLSNYSFNLLRSNPAALDFLPHTDGGVFSCIAKMLKPERRIYARICSEYGLTPENCVFIDDLEKNIEGARRFGMKGIRFINYEQAAADLDAMLSGPAHSVASKAVNV